MDILIQFAYIVSGGLFIFGLKQLGSPATARRGNMISATAMLVASRSGTARARVLIDYQDIVIGFVAIGGC